MGMVKNKQTRKLMDSFVGLLESYYRSGLEMDAKLNIDRKLINKYRCHKTGIRLERICEVLDILGYELKIVKKHGGWCRRWMIFDTVRSAVSGRTKMAS